MSGSGGAPTIDSAGAQGSLPAALEQALRQVPTAMSGVASTLRGIVRALPPTDGVAAFTSLYLAVTEAVATSASAQTFEDERFTRALDVTFANLYFTALRDVVHGRTAVPAAWKPLVEARAQKGIFPLQFALAGMNAHINRDLPVALVQTCTSLGVDLKQASAQHRDFRRIDGVLEQTEERVKSRFVTGGLAAVDGALGHLDDCVAMWDVGRARDAAWTNAETLWALRGAPHLGSKFLLTLDRMVGFASRGLLCPLREATPNG